MSSRQPLPALAVMALLLGPGTAAALELDYYTYNGFAETVSAFQRLALIFNDNEYVYLIFIAVVLGIVFAAMTAGVRALKAGGNGDTLSWVLMVFIGVALFKGLVIPKGTVHVYDPVRNAYQAVANVPDLIILIAGGMNKAERVVVELVDNAAAFPYQDGAGGINFQMLLNAMNDYSGGFDDHYLTKSVKRYYSDCSQMALIQSSYNFDLNQLRSGTNNLMALLAELRSPADFTEWYDVANKGGVTVSCQDAWNNHLQAALNDGSLYDAMLGSVCSKSGFNTADAAQLARCQTILAEQNLSIYNVAADHVHFLRNAALATAIAAALQDENPDIGLRALTNRAVLTEGIGVAQAANEWLPTIRATVIAIVLGLFPLLVVFLVTPLMPKALLVMFGLIAWITLWGVADAVMHRSAMDQAFAAVEEIQRHDMGLTAMMLTPEAASKALAVFGKARSMGITIATFLAAALFGFSAHALNQIAESFQRRMETAGAEGAHKSLTPEGQAQSLSAAAQGFATPFQMGNMGFQRYAEASTFNSGTELSRADQYLSATSEQGMGLANAMAARGGIEAGADFGGLMASQGNLAKSGHDPQSAAALMSVASEVTNLEQAGRFGDARGKVEAMAGAGFGSANDFNEFVSAVQTVMTAGDSRTHAANIEMFKDIHDQRGGDEFMTHQDAADSYSRMRYSSISGDIEAFGASADRAIDFMSNNRHLQDHQLAGIISGSRALGLDPAVLAEASGRVQSAMQSANLSQLSSMPIGELASGAFANQVMATQSGNALQAVMRDEGLIQGMASLARNETLVRNATAEQLENLSKVTGIPLETLAMAQAGANRSFSFQESDLPDLLSAGIVSPAESNLLDRGGVASASISADGGTVTSSRVASGSSAVVDDSTQVAAGFNAGGANSAAMLLTNPANEERLEQVLRATEGNETARDALKMDMAAFIGNVQTSSVTLDQSARGEVYAGWSVPKVAGLLSGVEAGARGSLSGGIADRTSHNVIYGAVDQAFDTAYLSAKSEVKGIADDRIAHSEPVTAEDREDILFDRFASHLNSNMGQLLSNLKENHGKAMMAAEDMEEVPEVEPNPGKRPNLMSSHGQDY